MVEPHTDVNQTSLSTLSRARANDPEAWRRLVYLYSPLLNRWCSRAGLQPADTADVLQDLFAAVHSKLGAFRKSGPEDSFRGWLWSITRNKIRDHLRAARRHPQAVGGSEAREQLAGVPADDPAAVTGCDTLPAAGDGAEVLRRALEMVRTDFEPGTWQAFWRLQIDGLPAPEVAAELG